MNIIDNDQTGPAPNAYNIETVNNAFNDVANAFNDLWLLTNVEMPDELISEGYETLITRLTTMTRITQDRFTQHVRRVERLAREARGRARRERQNVQPPAPIPTVVSEEPVVLLPAPQNTAIQPVAIVHTNPAVAVQPRVRIVHNPKRIVRALKRSDLEATLEDDCSICMNKYTKSDAVYTSCGHTFCKVCFDNYERITMEKDEPIVAVSARRL